VSCLATTRSRSFEITLRFEMGRYEPTSAASRCQTGTQVQGTQLIIIINNNNNNPFYKAPKALASEALERLERLKHMNDLGVIFDSELNFVQHCKEKINTAYSYLGIIKRNFIHLDEDALVMLYKSLVISHLEYQYANSVWNPYTLGLTKDLEKVQMRATKLVISSKNLTYKDRLKRSKLPTLKHRHIRGDMIEVYKILTYKYDSKVNLYLEKQQDSITRGYK